MPMEEVWEKEIRTVRSVLSCVLSKSPGGIYDAPLRLFFYEAMTIAISRPLTTKSISDPKHIAQACYLS